MAKYVIVCEAVDVSDIYLTSSGFLKCSNGATLELVSYQPNLSDLTYQQVGELAGATLLLFTVAWLVRFVVDHLTNKR